MDHLSVCNPVARAFGFEPNEASQPGSKTFSPAWVTLPAVANPTGQKLGASCGLDLSIQTELPHKAHVGVRWGRVERCGLVELCRQCGIPVQAGFPNHNSHGFSDRCWAMVAIPTEGVGQALTIRGDRRLN
jgi:hypothetical protein